MTTKNSKVAKKIIKCIYCNSVNVSKSDDSRHNRKYKCGNCGIKFDLPDYMYDQNKRAGD